MKKATAELGMKAQVRIALGQINSAQKTLQDAIKWHDQPTANYDQILLDLDAVQNRVSDYINNELRGTLCPGLLQEIKVETMRAWLDKELIIETSRGEENIYFENAFGHKLYCKCL